jgi:hypothetical protein
MECREVRALADGFLSDQLLVETTQDIVHHLETCATCREELAARRLLRRRLQTAFATTLDLAPDPDLIGRLAARLEPRARPVVTRRAWLRTWGAAAASVIAMLGGAFVARGAAHRARLRTLGQSAVADHRLCAVKFRLPERPISLTEAARKYDAALAALTTLMPPADRAGSLEVVDRHSCVYQDRRFGHVVFRERDRLVSLLVTPFDDVIAASPEMLSADLDMNVAAFSTARHAVLVVADLGEGETLSIARSLALPVSRGLAGT